MPATNLGGYTKRTTGVAIVFMTYCVGNIIGPHAFLAKESPKYPTGCKVILACSVTQVAIALALRFLLMARNKKRDAAAPPTTNTEFNAVEESGGDLTDFEVCLTSLDAWSEANGVSRIKTSDISIKCLVTRLNWVRYGWINENG